MDEKYFIINVENKFYVIIKCTQRQLSNYINYGMNYSKDSDGMMNLSRLTQWLITHNMKFRADMKRVKNIIARALVKRSVRVVNNQAVKSHMMISYKDMEQLLSAMEHDDYSLCWNFDNSIN